MHVDVTGVVVGQDSSLFASSRHIIDSHGAENIGDIVAAGGGAKSRLWRQIIANVTHKTVLAPKIAETTLLGAAILAAVGTGLFATPEELLPTTPCALW